MQEASPKTRNRLLAAGFVPSQPSLASPGHSGIETGGRRNETDHHPLRAQADGLTTRLNRDLRGQRAGECFENCAEIGPLSNSRLPAEISRDESFCCLRNDSRSSGRVLAFP